MPAETIVKSINEKRSEIKALAGQLLAFIGDLKTTGGSADSKSNNAEMYANLMLAYRHIEDASMRLGKAIQATDGGESVYDKTTTVGVDLAAPGTKDKSVEVEVQVPGSGKPYKE